MSPVDVLKDILKHNGILSVDEAVVLMRYFPNYIIQAEFESGKVKILACDFKNLMLHHMEKNDSLIELSFSCAFYDLLCLFFNVSNRYSRDLALSGVN